MEKADAQPFNVYEDQGMQIIRAPGVLYEQLHDIEHLRDAVEIMRDRKNEGRKSRYIINAPDRYAAYQAALADMGISDEDIKTIDVIKCDLKLGDEHSNEKPPTGQSKVTEYMSKTQKNAVMIDASEANNYKEVYEFIALFSRKAVNTNIYIFAPVLHEEYIRKLEFELDYYSIKVKRPTVKYLASIFRGTLTDYGCTLSDEVDAEKLVERLMIYRSGDFTEKDVNRLADKAAKNGYYEGHNVLTMKDFEFLDCSRKEDPFEGIIGHENIKEMLRNLTYVQRYRKEREGTLRMVKRHMAFAGAPGTGKSTIAQRLGEYMRSHGLITGKVVMAAKSDIVGKFTGHTAAKVRKLFEEAKGGILFIDEAGGLLTEDEFTREAITEIVRYTESCDVMVIFASYNDKIERLLDLDQGLRSRVQTIINFKDYTDEELWQIFVKMLSDRGFTAGNIREGFIEYITWKKQKEGENFGNGREVRNLVDIVEEVVAKMCIENGMDVKGTIEVGQAELDTAIRRIKNRESCETGHRKRRIGFCTAVN